MIQAHYIRETTMYRISMHCFVLAALLIAMGCGGPKEDLTHLLVAGERIGVVMEDERIVSLNSKENEPVVWTLNRFGGVIESWDADGLTVVVDDVDVPEGLLDTFSSDRNRLVVDVAQAGGRDGNLGVSFEPIGDSGSGVVVRITDDLVAEGLRRTEDGLELRI
ncbi:MAG: hypothetical protein F4Z81_09760 [Gemmatimonadetes bacterium]|nr:hypothetical protein [Gemmatimonadota bacterium]MYB59924.1 hypothetical protein [Gemmatimonadota bacterium]